jgi:acetoacetate decarboxylase
MASGANEMAKFGLLTPDKWGSFMPVHNPVAMKGPWYYRDTQSVIFEYLTDTDLALNVLPAELELHEPATAFIIIETNRWTSYGPYSEVYNGILCKWKGELHAYTSAAYVTSEASQIVGREVWGFGKSRAHRVELIHHVDGQIEAILEIKPGDRALRALFRPAKNEPPNAISNIPLVVLRVIPDAEGARKPALAQLISVTFDVTANIGSDGKAEIYSGPGYIQFGCPSDADLPVLSMISCKYARFNGDLPYGRILKTYTREEL